MLLQIACNERVDMQRRPFALGDRVRAVGVHHQVERFAQCDEAIDEPLRALVVHVVVARTLNDPEPPLETLGEVDRRTKTVAFHVLLRQPHVALLLGGFIIHPSSTTPPPTSTVKNSVGRFSCAASFCFSAALSTSVRTTRFRSPRSAP